nr:hypothetical protein [Chlamydiota bacterium]
AIYGKDAVVELLINNGGADTNLKDNTEAIALVYALGNGYDEIARMLEKEKSSNNNDESSDNNKVN